MTKYINGKAITAYGFAFDGCHKFYLIETPEDEAMMRGYGYELYDIGGLPRAWADSCPLRFIDKADLSEMVVPQCTPAYFQGDWTIDIQLRWELNALAEEQVMANEAVEMED